MNPETSEKRLAEAAQLIRERSKTVAFTGAGISVESGIPDFRGPNGVWSKIDTKYLELGYFKREGASCWPVIYEMFFKPLQQARPNHAHEVLAYLEREGLLAGIITQNIDNLHHRAGSKFIVEFHGNTRFLVCPQCGMRVPADFSRYGLPPLCPQCHRILKPDFIFFGEPIPTEAWRDTEKLLKGLDVMLIIGTTGVVFPAGQIPLQAKKSGARIIEINLSPSVYTREITDIFIQRPASRALAELQHMLWNP